MLAEPVTLLTDYALAGVSGWLGWLLLRRRKAQASRGCWVVAFFSLALAAVLDGTHHGSAQHMNEAVARVLWMAAMVAVGAFSFGIVAGSAIASSAGAPRAILIAVAALVQ